MNTMRKIQLNLIGAFLIYLKSFCQDTLGVNDGRSFKGAIRTRDNSFFTAAPLLSTRTKNAFACTHVCLANTYCIAIVYCEHGTKTNGQCYLFNEGIHSEHTDGISPSLVEKEGCTFYQFADVFEGCSKTTCHNGGSCYHDNEYGGFKCTCVGKYIGDFCNKKEPIVYRFTNLQRNGRTGPTSLSGYTGTTLERQVALLEGQQIWIVPTTGRYHFDVQGASGGDGRWSLGGKGAKVSGFATLTTADRIIVVVGQRGVTNVSGGGGGGSFVFYSDKRIIAIAGGGGGGGGLITQLEGEGGLANLSGGVYGGRSGHGGKSCSIPGYEIPGGGGGYESDGECYEGPTCNDSKQCNEGGGSSNKSFVGGLGDKNGGFGGGGAANGSFPGGGGGYSGGGVNAIPSQGQAGGGGSKMFDSSWEAVGNYKSGQGSVIITFHG